jgi:hypothetical protein
MLTALVVLLRSITTVLRWHRQWLRSMDAALHKDTSGAPQHGCGGSNLVGKMAAANPLWGAPRIDGELGKLGIEVSERTVSRFPRRLRSPAITDVANVSWESRGVSPLDGLPHCADPHGTRAIRLGAARPSSSTNRPCPDHAASHGRVDGAATG